MAEQLVDSGRLSGSNKLFVEEYLQGIQPNGAETKERLIEIYDLIFGYGVERS